MNSSNFIDLTGDDDALNPINVTADAANNYIDLTGDDDAPNPIDSIVVAAANPVDPTVVAAANPVDPTVVAAASPAGPTIGAAANFVDRTVDAAPNPIGIAGRDVVYMIAWICKLPTELTAARALLDIEYAVPRRLRNAIGGNKYVLGRMGKHNVVIVRLSSKGSTRAAVQLMLDKFPDIRFGLMVGVGGGVPTFGIDGIDFDQAVDIQLGDVVVSDLFQSSGGVIRYQLGKNGGDCKCIGTLNTAPDVLINAVKELRVAKKPDDRMFRSYINRIVKNSNWIKDHAYPGAEHDYIFKYDYDHEQGNNENCQNCVREKVLEKMPRDRCRPRVHYGLIASDSSSIGLDGRSREKLRKDLGVLCVENVAVGLADEFPCVVIRGICDYADTHKNSRWQPYAAATAAAYARALVVNIEKAGVENTQTAQQAIDFPKDHRRQLIVCPRPKIGSRTVLALYQASEDQDVALVEYLVNHMTPKEVGWSNNECETALHVSGGHPRVVAKILTKMPPQDLGWVSDGGDTALELSIRDMWDVSLIAPMLYRMLPKDFNRIGEDGKTALHLAVEIVLRLEDTERNYGVVNCLLKKMSLQCVWALSQRLDAKTALHMAVEGNDLPMTRAIMSYTLDEGEFRIRDYKGRTGLHLAVEKGYDGIVDVLLERMEEADILSVDKDGRTALGIAEAKGNKGIATQLRDKLVELGVPKSALRNMGQTADARVGGKRTGQDVGGRGGKKKKME